MERRVVTVFGGSGFIGRHLVRLLAANSWIVRVAVRDPEEAMFLKVVGEPGQVVPIFADITQPDSVARATKDVLAVVNLVGILYERGSRTFPRMHIEGALNVAQAARSCNVSRFVQMSAIGADPDSPAKYGQTKAEGERQAMQAYAGANIIRPSIVFGPEDKFFNKFASMARFMPVLPVFETMFQPVYVGDVAEAIVRILHDQSTVGRIYELGGPRVISFRELMQLVIQATGRRRLLVSIPFGIAEIQAWFLEAMPVPPLTRDQLKLLRRNNIVSKAAFTLQDLGIQPTAVEAVLPTYLKRHRSRPKALHQEGT